MVKMAACMIGVFVFIAVTSSLCSAQQLCIFEERQYQLETKVTIEAKLLVQEVTLEPNMPPDAHIFLGTDVPSTTEVSKTYDERYEPDELTVSLGTDVYEYKEILVTEVSNGTDVYVDDVLLVTEEAPAEESSLATEAPVDEEKKTVIVIARVAIEGGTEAEMRVFNLTIQTSDGEVLKNPPDWETPVRLYPKEMQLLQNLEMEKQAPLSSEIKKALINVLPKEATKVNSFDQMTELTGLLRKGDDVIELDDTRKDVVIVLGNTGAGKSTFTQWISDTANVLKSVEIEEGDYVIEDNMEKISRDTIQSQTIFPDLVLDTKNNISYYDLPGFSDTRSTVNDIASSYFTTKVIKHANTLKLIFIVNHTSVRKGVDRNDFVSLLRHGTTIIKNVEKFQNSIALVVSKVENNYRRGKLIGDQTVTIGVVEFLKEAKRVFERRKIDEALTLPAKELDFFENAIKFIEILLKQDGNEYSRIRIFRRPDDVGFINSMTLLETEKHNIIHMIHMLDYNERKSSDFGHTISASTKNEINEMIEELDRNTLFSICYHGRKAHYYFQNQLNDFSHKIDSINGDDLAEADIQMSEIKKSVNYFTKELEIFADLPDKIKIAHYFEEAAKIIESHTYFYSNLSSNILVGSRYMDNLWIHLEDQPKIHTRLLVWDTIFRNILSDINTGKNIIQFNVAAFAKYIDDKIIGEILHIENIFNFKYSNIEKEILDIEKLNSNMIANYLKLISLREQETSESYIKYFVLLAKNSSIPLPSHIPAVLMNNTQRLNVLKETINKVAENMNDSNNWYTFLWETYKTLSSYDYWRSTLCAMCYDYFYKNHPTFDGKTINEFKEFKLFLKCTRNSLYENIKNMKLDKFKINHLDQVINLVFSKEEYSCEANGKVVIGGFHVRISKALERKCSGNVKEIEIFALHTVIFDQDVKVTGAMELLAIVAPTWVVDKEHTRIDLVGESGQQINPIKASDGHDGVAGSNGGNSANFLGVGRTFINSSMMSVTSSGGDGGPGQNGGNGVRGRDGTTPYISGDLKQYLINKGMFYNKRYYVCGVLSCDYKPIYGAKCTNGGAGGRGGAGGLGGLPGYIQFVISDLVRLPRKSNTYGRKGKNGLRGKGGKAGRRGTRVVITWKRFSDSTKASYSAMAACFSGPDGANPILRYRRTGVKDIDTSKVMVDYERFVAKRGSLIKSSLLAFTKTITTSRRMPNIPFRGPG